MGIIVSWQRIPRDLLASPTSILMDGRGVPIAAVFAPTMARPLAAILDALWDDGGRGRLDDARADLGRYLARRLGLDEGTVAEALAWAARRAGVEIVPDNVQIRIRSQREE